jgi:hypothetical protein
MMFTGRGLDRERRRGYINASTPLICKTFATACKTFEESL